MSKELTTRELAAYPFLEAAVRIDTAKQNPDNKEMLALVLDDNVALWVYFKHLLLNSTEGVTEETRDHFIEISEFMIKAARRLLHEIDMELMDWLVTINLNTSERMLQAQDGPPVLHS